MKNFKLLLCLSLLLGITFISKQLSAQNWSALGSGTGDWVYTSTIYNGNLVVGGKFTKAGGNTANYIAKWNGTGWDSIGGGLDGEVDALIVYKGDLIAAGHFLNAGGNATNYVALWDGSAWNEMGSGMDNYVVALAVYGNNLIAGGYFTIADNKTANHIAQWDGNSWTKLDSGTGGTQGQVMALSTYGNKLIASGFFTSAGKIKVNHIAQWDGTVWDSLNHGTGGIVYALTNYNNNLIAGGLFSSASGVNAKGIAQWNGSKWDSLGGGCYGGLYGYVLALDTYNNNLYSGGIYTYSGNKITTNNIARWDGTKWNSMLGGTANGGSTGGVYTLTHDSTGLYAGGIFTSVGTINANNIAKWSGAITSVQNEQNNANSFLSQNIPNPFTSITNITFRLANSGNVKIVVLNQLGQEVITLLNEFKQAGVYTVYFDGYKFPQGIYYYKIVTPDLQNLKKMILLK